MTNITIRDVPEDVRNELAARARRSGRSLQEYLQGHLAALARRPEPEDLLRSVRANLGTTSGLTGDEIVQHVVADRR